MQLPCRLFAAFGLSSFHWHRLLKWELWNGLRINREHWFFSPAIVILEKSNLPQWLQSKNNMRTNHSEVHNVPFLLTRTDTVEQYSWSLTPSTGNLIEGNHFLRKLLLQRLMTRSSLKILICSCCNSVFLCSSCTYIAGLYSSCFYTLLVLSLSHFGWTLRTVF